MPASPASDSPAPPLTRATSRSGQQSQQSDGSYHRRDSDNSSVLTTQSTTANKKGPSKKVKDLFRNRSRSSASGTVPSPTGETPEMGGDAPNARNGEGASGWSGESFASGSSNIKPGGSLRASAQRKGSVPKVFMSAAERRSKEHARSMEEEHGVEELLIAEDARSEPSPIPVGRAGSIKASGSTLRRVSSKVFSNPFASHASALNIPATSPRLSSPLAAAPSPETSPTASFAFTAAAPLPALPPGAKRVSSSAYGDFDPISAADAASFSDDGAEGSLQDALDGADDPPRLPSVGDDASDSGRGKGRTKEVKPGRQHGAGFFPSPTLQPRRSASPTPPVPSALPPPARTAPAAASLRRPRISTNASLKAKDSAIGIVAAGPAGLPGRLSGWFQQALSSSTNLATLSQSQANRSLLPPPGGTPRVAAQPYITPANEAAGKSTSDLSISMNFLGRVKRSSRDPASMSPEDRKHLVTPPGHQQTNARGLGNLLDKAVNYLFDTDGHFYDMNKLGNEEMWVIGGRRFDGRWVWEAGDAEEVLAEWEGRGDPDISGPGTSGKKGKRRVKSKLFQRGGSISSAGSGSGSGSTGGSVRRSGEILRPTPSPTPSPEPDSASIRRPSDPSSAPRHVTLASLPPSVTHGYPPPFYVAFTSLVGLTYRTDFPPIPCSPDRSRGHGLGGMLSSISNLSMSIGRGGGMKGKEFRRSPSPAVGGAGDGGWATEDGLTSDAGWGCMLRTGQSLLANALIQVHLGRDWHRPVHSIYDAAVSNTASPSNPSPPVDPTYARILSWFLDSPNPLAPFSVHRFATKGKELGKEIGEWFGPSTAAGAIKALTNAFPVAGLGVVSDIDGTVYRSEVAAASSILRSTSHRAPDGRQRAQTDAKEWQRPVLVLVNLRLGIDGVHPSYHQSVKSTFTFPQSVGISGGRPSSSYYFFGYQANSLFYIDPHYPRPAISLEEPLPPLPLAAQRLPITVKAKIDGDWEHISTDADSVRSASGSERQPLRSLPSHMQSSSARSTSTRGSQREGLEEFYSRTYPDAALRTFHTERVRKMAISAMDPSMLFGFMVKDEAEWEDLCQRIRSLKSPLFHIAATTPAWMKLAAPIAIPGSDERPSDDSDMGVDSWSEPDDWDKNDDIAEASSVGSRDRSNSERWPSEEPETRPTSIDRPAAGDDEEWDDAGGPLPSLSAPSGPFPLARSDTLRPRGPEAREPADAAALASTDRMQPSDSGVLVLPPSRAAPNGAPIAPARPRHDAFAPPPPTALARPRNLPFSRPASSPLASNLRPNPFPTPAPSSSYPASPSTSPTRPAHRRIKDEPRSRNTSAATVRARASDDHLADSEETLNHGERRRLDSQGSLRALAMSS